MKNSFHSLIYKYTSKRIQFSKNHSAKIYCAILDWNDNHKREYLKIIEGCNETNEAKDEEESWITTWQEKEQEEMQAQDRENESRKGK